MKSLAHTGRRLLAVRGVLGCLLMGALTLSNATLATPAVSNDGAIAPTGFKQLSQLKRTLYTVRDGLPSTIYAIAEDRQGYVWLGGATGLFRFDGLNFKPMLKEQLPAELITALYGDRDGNLWVGGLHGKVIRVHEGVAEALDRGLNHGTVMSFKQMPDGTLWTATSGGVYRMADGAWRHADHSDGIEAKFVWVTGTGVDGSYWIFAPEGAYRLRPDAKRFELVNANQGVAAMAGLPLDATYPSEGVTADLIVDHDAALWIPTSGKLTRLHNDATTGQARLVAENIESAGHHAGIQVTADFSDSRGNVWIASAEGLEQFRSTRFTPLPLPLPVFWPAITEDSTQALWVASALTTPPMRVDKTVTVHPELSGSSACIAKGPDGSVWFNGDKGMQHYSKGLVSTIPAPPANGPQASMANPKQDCAAMQVASDGALWVSMRFTGVTRWDGQGWTVVNPQMATSMQFEGGRVWLAFPSGALVAIDQAKTATDLLPESSLLGPLRKLRLGPSGLWIAGDDGIAVKTASGVTPLFGADGEKFPNATDLVQLANGDLWVASARGVYRMSGADIRSALSDPRHTSRFTQFDDYDGVENAKNLVATDDGRLWLSMRQGVASIDALHMSPIPAAAEVTFRKRARVSF